MYGLIPWNNCGISNTLFIISSELKNKGSVSPIAKRVNGITFAVSAEALSPYLGIYETTLNDATVIAASRIIALGSMLPAIKINKIAKIINQKKINIGKIIRYSKKYRNPAVIFARRGCFVLLYLFKFNLRIFFVEMKI